VKNLAGGGEMQRDKIAIADLEIKAATLEAARAELERQREEEKVNLGDKVLRLLLDYEAVSRKVELVRSQLKTYSQQQEILRIRYRLGEGETAEFLESQVRGDGLRSQLTDLESLLAEKVRELGQLIGDESVNSDQLSVINSSLFTLQKLNSS
jgi:outer membrane protein TolC